MRFNSFLNLVTVAICVVFFTQCKPKPTKPEQENFDKEAMLKSIVENVITTNYATWKTDCDGLSAALSSFETTPSESNFASLKNAVSKAYLSWDNCSVFEFGPAVDQNLRLKMNTFPVDTAQVESNLKSGNNDLGLAKNADARGFPALDYLLFYNRTADQFDQNEIAYLKLNVAMIVTASEDITSKWGDYKGEFTANTASSVGSPIGLLINQINYEFELIKNARIGIPMGKKTLGITQPTKLEGYYSDQSRALLLADLNGIQNTFSGGSGIGFDDYLDALGIQKDNKNLSQGILDGFKTVQSSLDGISSLKATIESDETKLEPTYAAIQQLLILLKTDLPSQLGVQITYQDNDGD